MWTNFDSQRAATVTHVRARPSGQVLRQQKRLSTSVKSSVFGGFSGTTQRLKVTEPQAQKGHRGRFRFYLLGQKGARKGQWPALPLRAAFPRAFASMKTGEPRKLSRASRFRTSATGWTHGRCRFLNSRNGRTRNATVCIAGRLQSRVSHFDHFFFCCGSIMCNNTLLLIRRPRDGSELTLLVENYSAIKLPRSID